MKLLFLAGTALAMLSGAAYAQTSLSGSNSDSTAINSSASRSSSVSSPRVNVIGNPIGNGASSSNSGAKATANTRSASRSAAVGNTTNVNVQGYQGYTGGGDPGGSGDPSTGGYTGIGYSGGYSVHNTPEVIPPSVVGGNPCAVGASGGLSVSGFGIAGGATWADKACERRQAAALMFNMGETKVAYELMCQDEHVHQAMVASGKPCTADIPPTPVAQAAPASPVVQTSALPAPTAPVAMAAVVVPPKPARPEWCWTATKAELRGRAECEIR